MVLLSFFVEYTDPRTNENVRDLSKISWNYLTTQFITDLIPLIPLQAVRIQNFQRLFYLIKLIRLQRGLELFNVTALMQRVEYFNKMKLKNLIDTDPEEAEDIIVDNNKIQTRVMVSFLLKIVRLVVIISNISYFLGFLLYIAFDMIMEHMGDPGDSRYFIKEFNLDHNERSNWQIGIIMVYYAFTSLSTVGFGDYNPRSDGERLICAMILLFGVAIFSYIMGTFIEILGDYQSLNADLDDGDSLTQFFLLLQKFNEDAPLAEPLRNRIEEHFQYKWAHDRNQAIDDKDEI